ncbi:PLC-like phosphodiesterase [Dissoconium aciculare CBS 342.82]|uniref:PLC-like phosphodiesterase n=1 Tax=Dissoconium aciculare CBS 342.82 TaxID=1314786 RepID=A0A6J3MFN6_9PEZI|nr:PLC-like phosphodiesterase [Dissoconium aciculare CBS 342.82]KAF1826469.1 PLC-like phosphodiesterase [Dissoconium aciculare CBS 342.82]
MRFCALLLAGISLSTAALLNTRQVQNCSGRPEFCDRKYSNVSLIGAHDSGFVGPILDPRVNQELNVKAQLDAGIRWLEIQVHVLNGVLSLCHTSCLELYAGSLAKYLSDVKTWLDSHPNDVVSMILANADRSNVTQYDAVFNATGLKKYAFIPETSPQPLSLDQWPTYRSLIAAGTRAVVFMDYRADEPKVPYILDEFKYYSETPYDTTDPNFAQCTIDRAATTGVSNSMYIMNHFLDTNVAGTGILIPDNVRDFQTNNATGNGSIGAQADLCVSLYNRPPNVVFVDFFNRGDVFRAQDNLNGIKRA